MNRTAAEPLFRKLSGQKAFFSGNPSEQLIWAKTNRQIIDLSVPSSAWKTLPDVAFGFRAGRFIAE